MRPKVIIINAICAAFSLGLVIYTIYKFFNP